MLEKHDELVQVEKAILSVLKANSFDVDSLNFKKLVEGQMLQKSRPSALITSNTGSFKKQSANRYDMMSVINLYLVIHDLQNDASNEFAAAGLVKAVFDTLTHNRLGLFGEHNEPVIKNGLIPVSYNNVTSFAAGGDLRGIGYAVYECVFKATLLVDELPQPQEVDRGIIKSMVIKYYGNDDSIAEIESDLDFTEIDGGNAYTDTFDTIIDGGSAGTQEIDYTDTVDGGKANTDYDC